MHTDLLNMTVAFFEGLALIISPCILPILPIILAGSLAGGKKRPLGIIMGFILMFSIVTLFSRALIQFLQVSDESIRNASYIILFMLGIVMFSTYLSQKFNTLTQGLLNIGSSLQTANNPESGFWGGILFGGLVGIIWTPCAGPIFAAVIVEVVLQKTTTASLLVVLAFAIGAALPMLIIALIGRKVMSAFHFFRKRSSLIRKILGFIIIVTVIYLAFFSATASSLSEERTSVDNIPMLLTHGLEKPYQAPDIEGIETWLNSNPLPLKDLKGKVILIDFWTYSCINCIRTLPYLKDWYAKYHDQGFVIIGVHSPEFQFEHDINNVKAAVRRNGILYPVALDNRFVTWQNFHNQYWPAHYLINKKGEVVYVHFGEGKYDVTENNIRYLLGLQNPMTESKAQEAAYMSVQTPETYLGYDRSQAFSSPESIVKDQVSQYSYPDKLTLNQWALKGKWIIYRDKIVAASKDASLSLSFFAKEVYAVSGSPLHPMSVKLILNGKQVITEKGSDVDASQVQVSAQKLYALIHLKKSSEGTLELIAANPGLEIYTFTFGS
jgi:cytochrome c biogenesis protein CcdA/thiol-disulfide isomerase/thioredoxin